MKPTYTALIQRDGKWWIGWVEELSGVNAQARTRNELLADLKIALTEALAMDRARAVSADREGVDGEVRINTSDGECVIFTPVLSATEEKRFRKALDMVHGSFGRAMKRLAD